MAERQSHRAALVALAAAGSVLALLAGLGGWLSAVAGTLAQPLYALAARHWRSGAPLSWLRLRHGLPPLSLLWGGVVAALALAIAWPLSALLATGSLLAAFSLSAVSGVALLVMWRLWPLWQGLERDGGALGDHWRALVAVELGAWRGLGVATSVLAIAAMVIVMAWPGLLGSGLRWALVVPLVAGSAGLHVWLQRMLPADALRYAGEDEFEELVDDDVDAAGSALATDAPDAPLIDDTIPARPPGPVEPLEPALYLAARTGRVERALELIEAGADPHAPPPENERDQRSLAVLAAVLPDLRLLRALIGRGVDLNHSRAGVTPLLAATRDSWHGRPDAVMTLLANGADPRATDAEGNTPLHFAARSSDPGVAALLRDAAAELEVLNHDGFSPLGVACAAGNWRLARFLLERSARPEPVGGQPALLAAASGEDDDARPDWTRWRACSGRPSSGRCCMTAMRWCRRGRSNGCSTGAPTRRCATAPAIRRCPCCCGAARRACRRSDCCSTGRYRRPAAVGWRRFSPRAPAARGRMPGSKTMPCACSTTAPIPSGVRVPAIRR